MSVDQSDTRPGLMQTAVSDVDIDVLDPRMDAVFPRRSLAKLQSFTDACTSDADFREWIKSDIRSAFSELAIELPPDVEVRVFENSADTYFVVLPPDPNVALEDESLTAVAGGKTMSSGGSMGSASTFSTSVVTLGSAATASTAGTAGSAG